ncbi:hypothetical protein D3C87_334330 [compost metagenome]
MAAEIIQHQREDGAHYDARNDRSIYVLGAAELHLVEATGKANAVKITSLSRALKGMESAR